MHVMSLHGSRKADALICMQQQSEYVATYFREGNSKLTSCAVIFFFSFFGCISLFKNVS